MDVSELKIGGGCTTSLLHSKLTLRHSKSEVDIGCIELLESRSVRKRTKLLLEKHAVTLLHRIGTMLYAQFLFQLAICSIQTVSPATQWPDAIKIPTMAGELVVCLFPNVE